MFNEKDIQEILDQAKPSIIESFKDEIKRHVTYQVKDAVGEEIQRYIIEWIKKEILPEIAKGLIESKESLISIGTKIAPVIVKELAKSITDHISEKLKDSWERKKIFKAIIE